MTRKENASHGISRSLLEINWGGRSYGTNARNAAEALELISIETRKLRFYPIPSFVSLFYSRCPVISTDANLAKSPKSQRSVNEFPRTLATLIASSSCTARIESHKLIFKFQ